MNATKRGRARQSLSCVGDESPRRFSSQRLNAIVDQENASGGPAFGRSCGGGPSILTKQRTCSRWTCSVQVSIVKLHARLTATHALIGLAASVWDGASKARIGITLADQKAAGVFVMSHERLWK